MKGIIEGNVKELEEDIQIYDDYLGGCCDEGDYNGVL